VTNNEVKNEVKRLEAKLGQRKGPTWPAAITIASLCLTILVLPHLAWTLDHEGRISRIEASRFLTNEVLSDKIDSLRLELKSDIRDLRAALTAHDRNQ